MKLLIDVNLSPVWVQYLAQAGFDAVHWTEVGDVGAEDSIIMDWARNNACIVFTHDLDFSALLALAGATGPSVLQVRTQDVLPGAIGLSVIRVLKRHGEDLERGAIISIDDVNSRVRILPVRQTK